MQSVLLVDDDVNIVTGLQALLSIEDIPSAIATDAEAAESLVAREFYPIVLADLRLRTENDGLQLIEAVRRLSPSSRIAAMTGYATPDLERHLLGIGASTVLHKPFDSDVFLTTVRGLLDTNAPLPTGLEYEAIYRATAPRLRSMMKRRYNLDSHQCEDVLQQAWCVLLEKRAAVRDTGAFLSGTVVNLCRQTIQLNMRETPADFTECDGRSFETCNAATLSVRSALSRLDERSRNLCQLIGLDELSYAEVSERLGIPLGSVGPLYMRAKARLKAQLEN